MNLLNSLTIKNLKLNKKRTVMTIIGILLSVAMLTAVAGMFFSARESLILYEKEQKGDYHYAFLNVPKEDYSRIRNNIRIEHCFATEDVGYAEYPGIENEYKPYLFVKAFTKEAMSNLGIQLLEGRLPEREGEILLPQHLETNGGVTLEVGDTISLAVGERMSEGYIMTQSQAFDPAVEEEITDTVKKTYTIVGKMRRLSLRLEEYSAPGYTFVTYLDENQLGETSDFYIRYDKKGLRNHETYTARILDVDEEAFALSLNPSEFYKLDEKETEAVLEAVGKSCYGYKVNSQLLQMETGIINESSMQALGAAAGIVVLIIIITSVYCIRNSFDISITEKIRQYGMLSSVGATKKQIRRNVYFEAAVLGAVGIPLGVLSGQLAAFVLMNLSNVMLASAFQMKLAFSFSWLAVLFAAVLGMVTVFLSARKSAVKAAKITPIHAIRNSGDIAIKKSKIKCPKWVSYIFGIGGEIAYKNLKRSKKKYRTTVISITVCVAVFIAISSFVNMAFDMINTEYRVQEHNLSLSYRIEEDMESVMPVVKELDGINETTSSVRGSVTLNKDYYTDEYKEHGKKNGLDVSRGFLYAYVLDEESFRDYLKDLHLSYDKMKDKAVLLNRNFVMAYDEEKEEYRQKEMAFFDLEPGSEISCTVNEGNDGDAGRNMHVTVGALADSLPGYINYYTGDAVMILGEHYKEALTGEFYYEDIYINAEDAVKTEEEIEERLGEDKMERIRIQNADENIRSLQAVSTLAGIFLYGFIAVIALIGMTNIFNTITTNMTLRRREFAMLKSIGMTRKEFYRMIQLESFFYGTKSLIFGVPAGVLLSYILYKVMMDGSLILKYRLPAGAILISALAVFLLITFLMYYSIGKISMQNTIETIRNENI